MSFRDITYPDGLQEDLKNVQLALEGMIDSFSFEKRYIKKDGHLVWVKLTVSLLREESGNPIHFISAVIDITKRKELEEELEKHRSNLQDLIEERTVELEAKNITLQELNTTLRTLLKQREEDKQDMEERFVMNVQNLLLPYVEWMKKEHPNARQQVYLDMIERNIHEITTPLLKNMRQFNLTPTEVKVAMLVRQGKSTKEIAEILKTANGSISIHRKRIREKLGLTSKRANLQSYLESME